MAFLASSTVLYVSESILDSFGKESSHGKK